MPRKFHRRVFGRALALSAAGLWLPRARLLAQSQNQSFKGFSLPYLSNSNGLLRQLTAYWKMDEATGATRLDSTANALHLTDKNANLVATAGALNNCVICDQTLASDCLTHAAHALFNTGAGISLSFSAWLRGNGLIADHGIISLDDGSGNYAYTLWYRSTGASVTWTAQEAGTLTEKDIAIVTGAAMGTSVFHHFAFGYDDVAKLIWTQYDNGTRSTLAVNGMNAVTTTPFAVGNFSNFTAPQQILVDELAYYRRVLSVADVSTLFNGGTPLPFAKFGS